MLTVSARPAIPTRTIVVMVFNPVAGLESVDGSDFNGMEPVEATPAVNGALVRPLQILSAGISAPHFVLRCVADVGASCVTGVRWLVAWRGGV